jgi:hypothetical protein
MRFVCYDCANDLSNILVDEALLVFHIPAHVSYWRLFVGGCRWLEGREKVF